MTPVTDRNTGHVYLHVYNLAKVAGGICKVWHTAVYVYDKEFEFGPRGIGMLSGENNKEGEYTEIYMGKTDVGIGTLMAYLRFLGKTKFSKEKYDLFSNNCNSFANFLTKELVGESIPEYLQCVPGSVVRAGIESIGRTASFVLLGRNLIANFN